MNRQQLHSALAQATTSTFEELALLLVLRARAAAPDAGAGSVPPLGVRVDFDGPWAGSVVVRMSEAVLDAAAANMLGIAAAPDDAARRDALGELANVVCGNVLPAIAGRAAVFGLQAPRWIGAAAETCAASDACIPCAVDVDEGRALVVLHLPATLVEEAAAAEAAAAATAA